MKGIKIIPLVLVFLLTLGVGSGWAIIGLPTANFSGDAQTTATIGGIPGELTLVGAVISQANYLDGTSVSVNGVDESIIGMMVTISGAARTGDYSFTDAVITVSDGSFNYLSATLSDVIFVTDGLQWYLNPGLDVNNPSTLNMSNITLNTDMSHPSRYIEELVTVKGTGDALGMKMIIAIFSGSITGNGQADISEGLIDGTPETVAPPSGARTIGYWKNHDEERAAFIADAVALSTVFSTDTELNFYLQKKGKKNMEQKARQQLAAYLLNCASSLDVSTALSTGELEIYNLIVEPDATSANVGDAKAAIETTINSADAANMENAKDLADEINNRDHNNNNS